MLYLFSNDVCRALAQGKEELFVRPFWPNKKKVLQKIRAYSLHSDFVQKLPTEKSNTNFAYYLTGGSNIIEGDGSIHVPVSERSIKGSLNYPSIQISFHLKDLPLCLLIQKEIGHGSRALAPKRKNQNAYIYTVNNLEGLFLLVDLLNGKMKTNKIYALHRLIDWYNEYKKTSFDKRELNTESMSDNAWLSGFIEADGHFSIRSTETGKYPRIECKFELVQTRALAQGENKSDNLFFLEEVAIVLKSVVKSIRSGIENPQYRVRTTSLAANTEVISYLTKYPLFGSKFLDYNDWSKVAVLFAKGSFDHKLNLGSFAVKQIKFQMNDNRTIFVWDHLQNFYNLNK